MKKQLPSTEILGYAEIEIHYKRPLFDAIKHIKCSEEVNDLIWQFANTNQIDFKEFFWVVLLNNANRVLGISKTSMGSSSSVSVSVKEICQLALMTSSVHVIVIHNHPSGVLDPSKADKNITTKIKKALRLLDVNLLDHLIITSESYYSFADQGEL
ncbi:MAG: JAB domain-containing protein [Polaribacter sp.]